MNTPTHRICLATARDGRTIASLLLRTPAEVKQYRAAWDELVAAGLIQESK